MASCCARPWPTSASRRPERHGSGCSEHGRGRAEPARAPWRCAGAAAAATRRKHPGFDHDWQLERLRAAAAASGGGFRSARRTASAPATRPTSSSSSPRPRPPGRRPGHLGRLRHGRRRHGGDPAWAAAGGPGVAPPPVALELQFIDPPREPGSAAAARARPGEPPVGQGGSGARDLELVNADPMGATAQQRVEKRSGGAARSSVLMALGTVVSRATGLIRTGTAGRRAGHRPAGQTYNTANTVPTQPVHPADRRRAERRAGAAAGAGAGPPSRTAGGRTSSGSSPWSCPSLAVGTVLAVWAAPQIVSPVHARHPGAATRRSGSPWSSPGSCSRRSSSTACSTSSAKSSTPASGFGAMMWTPVLNNVVLLGMFGVYLGLMTVPDRVADVTPGPGPRCWASAHDRRHRGAGARAGPLRAGRRVPLPAAVRLARLGPRAPASRRQVDAAARADRTSSRCTVVTNYANAVDQTAPTPARATRPTLRADHLDAAAVGDHRLAGDGAAAADEPRRGRGTGRGRARATSPRACGSAGSSSSRPPSSSWPSARGSRPCCSRTARPDAASAQPLGHMLQAFGLGLIPFSAQYVLLRGFYAFEDTRTPFFMAVWIATVNIALATACHLLLPDRWAVTGMAGAYTVSYLGGPRPHRAGCCEAHGRPTGRRRATPHIHQAAGRGGPRRHRGLGGRPGLRDPARRRNPADRDRPSRPALPVPGLPRPGPG